MTGYDYVSIGHVTIDRMADGGEQVGGAAVYGAVQAARLGCRALIVTRGERPVIERLLEPFAGELDVWVQDAERTTTLLTSGSGLERAQRVLAWAGEIDPVDVGEAAVLHLAPVLREVRARFPASSSSFVGLTPQGLVRHWDDEGRIRLVKLPVASLPNNLSALAFGEVELGVCGEALAAAVERGAVGAVTHGARPAEIRTAARRLLVPAPRVASVVDELGAGDVFAAALFISLAAGKPPARAAELAQTAASLRIAGRGPEAIASAAAIEASVGR